MVLIENYFISTSPDKSKKDRGTKYQLFKKIALSRLFHR